MSWLDAVYDIGGSLFGGAADLFGGIGSGLASAGSNLLTGAAANPWNAIGTLGGIGANIAPYFLNQGGGPGGGFQQFDPGMLAQLQQPGAPTAQQIRRQIADAQSQGLGGASPDFLASMAGVTPQELEQMLGYNPSRTGAT